MSISIACRCGRTLRVKDELGGRRVRCPDCGGTVAVPEWELDEDPEPNTNYRDFLFSPRTTRCFFPLRIQ